MKSFILISLIFIHSLVFAERIYEIPIYDEPREPLVIIKNGAYSGVLVDAFVMILKRANIKFKFVPLPNERRRQGFIEEKYLIECCSNEAWRTKPEEIKIQLFSKDFFESNEIFVFSDKKFLEENDIAKLIFALVKGYDYGGFENKVKKKFHLHTESTQLKFLAMGRAEAAIINENIFEFYSTLYPKLVKGEVFKGAKLKIRVNKKEVHIYEAINKAIKEFKAEDAFSKILLNYKIKGHIGQILEGPSLSLLEEVQ